MWYSSMVLWFFGSIPRLSLQNSIKMPKTADPIRNHWQSEECDQPFSSVCQFMKNPYHNLK